jgi:hypothetical protein
MILQPTPDVRLDLIVVGTTIRKPPDIVRAYLDSLAAQKLPPNTRTSYHFILDTDDAAVVDMVGAFVTEHGGLTEKVDAIVKDFEDNHAVTHQWSPGAMARVGQLKNRIITHALDIGAVAVWFCDADLLCDDHTLRSLWYSDVPVACAVYWTRWHNDPSLCAAQQVWLRHPYELSGRGYADDGAFRARLLTRELTRVWGQGACTLIRREVLEKGVNFSYIEGVPLEGMMAGEDRHFCLQCENQHVPMWADPWPHIFHCYHPDDRKALTFHAQRLQAVHAHDGKPVWLNLKIRMLEPVQVGQQQWAHLPPVVVRVRCGAAAMLPELEKQCLQNLHGNPFLAQIVFPSTYPTAALRGKRKIAEVVVIDAKTDQGFPVLEDEMPDGVDLTTLSAEQQEALRDSI